MRSQSFQGDLGARRLPSSTSGSERRVAGSDAARFPLLKGGGGQGGNSNGNRWGGMAMAGFLIVPLPWTSDGRDYTEPLKNLRSGVVLRPVPLLQKSKGLVQHLPLKN